MNERLTERLSERGYITVPELAERWGVSLPSAYATIHTKGFPVLRVGRCLRIPLDHLEAWEERKITED